MTGESNQERRERVRAWLADPTTKEFFVVVKAREYEATQDTVNYLNSNESDGLARAAAAQALVYRALPDIPEGMKESEVEGPK